MHTRNRERFEEGSKKLQMPESHCEVKAQTKLLLPQERSDNIDSITLLMNPNIPLPSEQSTVVRNNDWISVGNFS